MRTIRIGRGHDNDVVLQDISVSRCHCQLIQYEDGSVIICDCGSSNGTFVNGRRIKGNTRLERSDSVRLGNVDFQWTSCVQTPRYQEPSTMYIPHESYIEPESPRAYVPYKQKTTNKSKKKKRDVDYHSVNEIKVNYNEGGFGRKFAQSSGKSAGEIVGCFIGVLIVIAIIVVVVMIATSK